MSSEMLQNLIFMNFSTNFLPFVHEDHLRSQPVLFALLPSGILATFPARTIEKLVFFRGSLVLFFFFFGYFLFSVNLFEFLVLVSRFLRLVSCSFYVSFFVVFFSFCLLYKDTDDIFT